MCLFPVGGTEASSVILISCHGREPGHGTRRIIPPGLPVSTAKTYEDSQALVHVSRPNLYRDREIRAGWKDGSSPTSTEAKIRDHRGTAPIISRRASVRSDSGTSATGGSGVPTAAVETRAPSGSSAALSDKLPSFFDVWKNYIV
jgi:hypothetical protein